MANKLVTIHFEVTDAGTIAAIHPGALPVDYVKCLIEKASADIQQGKFTKQDYNLPAVINPADKIARDVDQILHGPGFDNLPLEN